MTVTYNEDYFERGLQLGISGYTSYSWMPELTLKMAKFLINDLKLENRRVLDFGCAKGYLVKALRTYDICAYGYDASNYAISKVPKDIEKYCFCNSNAIIEEIINDNNIDFLIAKDVFEHLDETELLTLLSKLKNSRIKTVYAVVPLANRNDHKYTVESYENDVTHKLRKTSHWWENVLKSELGFNISMSRMKHGPIKENWTKTFPNGNLFILLDRYLNH